MTAVPFEIACVIIVGSLANSLSDKVISYDFGGKMTSLLDRRLT